MPTQTQPWKGFTRSGECPQEQRPDPSHAGTIVTCSPAAFRGRPNRPLDVTLHVHDPRPCGGGGLRAQLTHFLPALAGLPCNTRARSQPFNRCCRRPPRRVLSRRRKRAGRARGIIPASVMQLRQIAADLLLILLFLAVALFAPLPFGASYGAFCVCWFFKLLASPLGGRSRNLI